MRLTMVSSDEGSIWFCVTMRAESTKECQGPLSSLPVSHGTTDLRGVAPTDGMVHGYETQAYHTTLEIAKCSFSAS